VSRARATSIALVAGLCVVAVLQIWSAVAVSGAEDASDDIEVARAHVASLQADLREVRRERDALASEVRTLEASARAAEEAAPDLSCVYKLNGACLSVDHVVTRMVALEVDLALQEDASRLAQASAAVSYTGVPFLDDFIASFAACLDALERGEGRLETCGPLAIRLGTLGLY